MKILYGFIYLLVLYLPCFSQADDRFVLSFENLSTAGILLDKGWKFHPGDNPAWAQPGWDDRSWQPINPTLDIVNLPQVREARIGWFRLQMRVDRLLQGKTVALQVNQMGASEIYLNGKLIHRFGLISIESERVQTYDPAGQPIALPLSKSPIQVLTVRFACKSSIPYIQLVGRENACLSLRISSINQAVVNYKIQNNYFVVEYIRIGLFLILSVLHLSLFLFYPQQKANLYLFIFSFASLLHFLVYVLAYTKVHQLELRNYLFMLIYLLYLPPIIFSLKAIYCLFEHPKGNIYRALITGAFICIPLCLWPYQNGWISGIVLFPVFAYLESGRITLLAVKNNKRGAWIIAYGAMAYLFFFAISIMMFFGIVSAGPNWLYGFIIFTLAHISFPIAISLFIALEFGYTSRSLAQKLQEVEQLSQKTLSQEQERSQLLASEKERLEVQVQERTLALTHQKDELAKTLEHLKVTQTQLVEKEKASLEHQLTLERLQKEQELSVYQNRMAELEMQALRAQMNPHFIFNCLNSIDRFILKKDSKAASNYLTKFSRLIRLILQNSFCKSVPLEKELEALKLYMDMEMLRFEGQFSYELILDPYLEVEDVEIPPLLIQPYVENAIWHGLMHKEEKGQLTVELSLGQNQLHCQITDDGIGRERAAQLKSKSATKNKSMGMQITAHRLALINSLQEKATTVEVVDLVDASGEACGTKVKLNIPL